jgi:hypothetical protein
LNAQRVAIRAQLAGQPNLNLAIQNLEQVAVNYWNATNPFTPNGRPMRITSARALTDNLAPNSAGRYPAQLVAIHQRAQHNSMVQTQQVILLANVQFQAMVVQIQALPPAATIAPAFAPIAPAAFNIAALAPPTLAPPAALLALPQTQQSATQGGGTFNWQQQDDDEEMDGEEDNEEDDD